MSPRHKEHEKDVSLGKEIHFTIRASEGTIARITALLLLCEIPESKQKKQITATLLPYETEGEFEALPPTTEELHQKATELIAAICNTYIPGLDNVKTLLTSFGVPRFSALPDDKLPAFVQALETMPMDPAQLPAFIEALHASEADLLI